jgi:DNA-binding CsgD family transcriptional regulator
MTLSQTIMLTPRQKQVLGLLATGLTGEEIARELRISPRTVRSHLDVLRHKLGVTRSRQLPMRFRQRTGIDAVQLVSSSGKRVE